MYAPELYSEHSQKSKMEFFGKTDKSFSMGTVLLLKENQLLAYKSGLHVLQTQLLFGAKYSRQQTISLQIF